MGDTSAVMSVADIMAAAASCTAVNTMYSGVVEEVTRAEQVQIKIRQETLASIRWPPRP